MQLLTQSRKSGQAIALTDHPHPSVIFAGSPIQRMTYSQATDLGFIPDTQIWNWTAEDEAILKKTLADLSTKEDWIHNKDVWHWFSHSAFNGRISTC
jgi:hypothetical protein